MNNPQSDSPLGTTADKVGNGRAFQAELTSDSTEVKLQQGSDHIRLGRLVGLHRVAAFDGTGTAGVSASGQRRGNCDGSDGGNEDGLSEHG